MEAGVGILQCDARDALVAHEGVQRRHVVCEVRHHRVNDRHTLRTLLELTAKWCCVRCISRLYHVEKEKCSSVNFEVFS